MIDRVRALLVLLLLTAVPVATSAQDGACEDVTCSGRGTCFEERGVAHCVCNAGYAALGHACLPGGAGEEETLRARRDPEAARRVVALAESQIGRDHRSVGEDLGRHPFALRSYLEVGEWWCADFVSWVYEAAGVGFTGGAAGGWLVGNNIAIRAWFEQRGLWVERGDEAWARHQPRPGDYVRIHTDRGGHAAIVHHVTGDTLYAVEGNLGSRVELARYYHFRANHLIHGFGALGLVNAPPVVDAGEDATISRRSSLLLRGSVEDDGPFERLRASWATREGPAEADCERRNAPQTRCWFPASGTYVLRLSADDTEHTASDEIRVEVRDNRAPRVEVQLIELDASARTARVAGTAEDDEAITLRWAIIDGPAHASIDELDEGETVVRFAAPGLYTIRLTADDGELDAHRDLEIEVPEDPATWGCAIGGAPSRGGWIACGMLLAIFLGRPRTKRRR